MAKRVEQIEVVASFNDRLSAGIRSAQGRLRQFSSRIDRALGPINSRVGALTAGFVSLGAAMQSVGLAQTQQKAEARLSGLLEGNNRLLQERLKFAAQLQTQSVFGDEAILEATSDLLAAGTPIEQIDDALRAVVETASATGKSLDEVARNVGKTFGGLPGELGESVPAIKDLSEESLRAGGAVQLLLDRFAGNAAAQAASAPGQITQALNRAGDAGEKVGAVLQRLQLAVLPPLADAAERFAGAFDSDGVRSGVDKLANLARLVIGNAAKIIGVVASLKALSIAASAAAALAALATPVGAIILAIGAAGTAVYAFRDELGQLLDKLLESDGALGTVARGIRDTAALLTRSVRSIFDGSAVEFGEYSASITDFVVAAFSTAGDVIGAFASYVGRTVRGVYDGILDTFNAIGVAIESGLNAALSLVGTNVGQVLDGVLNGIRAFANTSVGLIVGTVNSVNALIDTVRQAVAVFANVDPRNPLASLVNLRGQLAGVAVTGAADVQGAFGEALGVDYVGEGVKVGQDLATGLQAGFSAIMGDGSIFAETVGTFETIADEIGRRAEARRQQREGEAALADRVGQAIANAKQAASTAIDDFAAAVKAKAESSGVAAFFGFGTTAGDPASDDKPDEPATKQVRQLTDFGEGVAGAGASSITDALDAIATKSQSAAEALRDMATSFVRSVGQMIAQAAALRLIRSLLGGIPGFTELVDAPVVPTVAANTGGQIPDDGGPDRDRVLAALTPGEYVIRRSAVRALGVGLLERLNAAGAGARQALAGVDVDAWRSMLHASPYTPRFAFNTGGMVPGGQGGPAGVFNRPSSQRLQAVPVDMNQLASRTDFQRLQREMQTRLRM